MDDWVKARVLEDNGSLKFDGLAEYEAMTEADALRLLWLGSERRKTGRTKANDLSSRSPAVFTLYVFDEEARTRAKLHLVDLAGSERFSYRTKDVASFESRNINLSLHHLEHVVRTLCETSPALSPRKHVPYRNSVLTSMLRDSLGGNCRTALVATLAADAEHARESAARQLGIICELETLDHFHDHFTSRTHRWLPHVVGNCPITYAGRPLEGLARPHGALHAKSNILGVANEASDAEFLARIRNRPRDRPGFCGSAYPGRIFNRSHLGAWIHADPALRPANAPLGSPQGTVARPAAPDLRAATTHALLAELANRVEADDGHGGEGGL